MSQSDDRAGGPTNDAEFAAAHAAFVAGLPTRIASIAEAVERLSHGDAAAAEAAYSDAHSLAGVAGSFGMGDIGRAAQSVARGVRNNAPPETLRASYEVLRKLVRQKTEVTQRHL